ncbi:MAG: sulfatase-like hydrolase/transferase [Erysipelotrichaceae bacterium]
MKKNVILIVMDSIYNESTKEQNYKKCPMPFLNKIKNEAVTYENVYSQGPFTEAALMAIVAGQYTLNNNGYANKFLDTKSNIFKTFYDNGYDTYHAFHPNNYVINNMPEITNGFYLQGFDLGIVFEYRLKYYIEKKEWKKLKKYDYYVLTKNIELFFNSCIGFFSDIAEHSERLDFIEEKEYEQIDLIKTINELEEEKEIFVNDKIKYLDEMLTSYENHKLKKINTIVEQSKVINSEIWFKYAKGKYGEFLNECSEFEIMQNSKNNKFEFKKFINLLSIALKTRSKEHLKKSVKLLLNYSITRKKSRLFDFQNGNTIGKAMPSANSTFDFYIECLKKRNKDKPFFCKIHLDDCHYKSTYFSYDSHIKTLIDEEFAVLKKYKQSLNSNFKGDICYDFSLRYMDYSIERFFNNLKKIGVLENTEIIITADHGYSYTNLPVRENFVNNFYKENYNVPLIIFNSKSKRIVNHGIHSSVDLQATIYSSVGIKSNSNKGRDMMNSSRIYAPIEYAGPGCPDLLDKAIYLGVRNNDCLLVYECKVNNEFSNGVVTEFYDLVNDPQASRNLAYSKIIKNYDIESMLKFVKQRFDEIRNDLNLIGEKYE